MPNRRGIRVLLLVEDEALERFVYRVLLAFRFQRREIYVKPYPKGQGSAKDWVARNYAGEVREHRRKVSSQPNIALFVGTDADEKTVQERARALDTALEAVGLEKRRTGEKFCLIIPKWNIEAWLVYLSGETVVEDRNIYKNHRSIRDVDYDTLAEEFVIRYRDWKQGNLAESTPPSMIASFEEMKRFDL